MSVIMKREFVKTGSDKDHVETIEPIEYIDSIAESSYINAINTAIMREIRKLSFEAEVFGKSDVSHVMIKSEDELSSKDEGFWILDTSKREPDKNMLTHSLTLYQKIKYSGIFWDSYETHKIAEFYNVECKRVVPRIIIKPTRFEKFETELESRVKEFRENAERNGVCISEPRE